MSLREEIFTICSRHNFLWGSRMTDDILKLIEKRIDEMIKEESQGSLYHMASDSVLTLIQVKELLK